MKKIMLLALAAVSALLALPAFASANPPLHVSTTGAFTVEGGASKLQRTSGGGTEGKKVTGTGSFETTTTGTVELTFSEVTSQFGACTNVKTTKLPFHLVTLDNGSPGILITSVNGHFATFTCAGFVPVVVTGNGILGTITAPGCGGTSSTATLSFKPKEPGHQEHISWTGTTYDLTSSIFGSQSTSSMDATATVKWPAGVSKTLTCT